MERKPLTRQRSPWERCEGQPAGAAIDALRAIGSSGIEEFDRLVHDGNLHAIISCDPVIGWHLSISHIRWARKGRPPAQRYPSWDELADARYELLPSDIDVVMKLPPEATYVALHDTTFHLHELRHPAEVLS